MQKSFLLAAMIAFAGMSALASAGPAQKAVLDHYAASAKAANPAFTGFSAAKGQAFFSAKHAGGQPDTPSCTTCHTADPTRAGQTRTGKDIKPMAVSANPERFADLVNVEKWFRRNCDSVLGRECTATEKGDFITFMSGR